MRVRHLTFDFDWFLSNIFEQVQRLYCSISKLLLFPALEKIYKDTHTHTHTHTQRQQRLRDDAKVSRRQLFIKKKSLEMMKIYIQ